MDVTGIEIGLGLTLAQDDAPIQTVPGDQPGGEGTSAPPPARPAPSPMTNLIFWIPLLLVFVFLIWSSSSAQRKEKKRREQMLSTIKKHDRVQTIGGVIGSVVEIRPDEVVLKVDESSNTKMRFAKSAIQQVLSESPEGGTGKG